MELVVIVDKPESSQDPDFIHTFNPGIRIFDCRIERREEGKQLCFPFRNESSTLMATSLADIG